KVEYNVFYCSGQVGVYHTELNQDKNGDQTFSIVSAAKAQGELVNIEKPPVFAVIDYKEGPTGIIARTAVLVKQEADDKDVTLIFFTFKDRIIGFIKDGDSFSAVIYGIKGPAAKAFDNTDAQNTFCVDLHQIDKKEVPGVVIDWLIKSNSVPPVEH